MPAPTILEALDDPALFAAAFAGPSWRPWRGFLGCMFGLPLPPDLASLARAQTNRADALSIGAFREAWLICGRRAGKSRVLALIAVYLACFVDWKSKLSVGETGVIMILAADRDQAGVILAYIKGLILSNSMLAALITSDAAESITLGSLRVSIEVHTNSYRSPRGRTVIAALCDEVAFWRSETSANPGEETVRALRPSLATLSPYSLLIGASSPYARNGLLYNQYAKHYGREGSKVLVWKAPSLVMNPGLDREVVDQAYQDDEEAASAEYGAEFRRDVERFVSREVIDAAVINGRLELPRVFGARYFAFVDPSGGSKDSFTLGVAHRESNRAILDHVSEVKPPFSPDEVASKFAAVMKSYGVTRATSDKYGGVWVAETFYKHGITVEQCAKPKSELYLELLPGLTSGRVELLDHPRLLAQLGSLDRRTARSGKDSVDHPPGGHDDIINSAAGALTMALGKPTAQVDFTQGVFIAPRASIVDLLDNSTPWSAPSERWS